MALRIHLGKRERSDLEITELPRAKREFRDPGDYQPGKRAIFRHLAKLAVRQGFSIGVQNLEVVDPRLGFVLVGPDYLFVPVDLDEPHLIPLGMVTGDDRVAVGEPLYAAGVIDQTTSKVLVVDLPNDPAFGIDLDDQILEGAADQGVSIRKANRGERPKRSLHLPNNFSLRRVFAHDLVQKLGNQIVSVGELSGHARLQVVILGLRLERHLGDNLPVATDFEYAGFGTRFGQKDGAAFEHLGGVDFGLGSFVKEEHLPRLVYNRRRAARVRLAFVQSKENRTILQNLAVPRSFGKLPNDFSVMGTDVGRSARGEEAMGNLGVLSPNQIRSA